MRVTKQKIGFIFCMLFSIVCYSGVNIKTGEFYISYSDIEPQNNSGVIKSISRNYSSKSLFKGLFGFGWSSELDSFIGIYPDGSLVLHQYGTQSIYFESGLETDDLVNIMIDELIKIGIKEGKIENNPAAIFSSREKFKDQHTRVLKWDYYVKNGLAKYNFNVPVGMEWESYQYGNQKITKTVSGFLKSTDDNQEYYNLQGQIIKIVSEDTFSEFEYTNGKLSKIINNDGSFYLVTTNMNGLIIKIAFGDEISTYKYDNENLVESEDAEKNNYKYSYDLYYNMNLIRYTDGTSMKITYDPETFFVTQINYKGEISEYIYTFFYNEDGSEDQNHYATTITKTNKSGEKNVSYFEYLIKEKENGETYISKFINEENGLKTTYIMDDLCNYLIEKIVGNEITKYKYNNRCLVIEEISPSGKIITQKWHPEEDKIIEVNDGGIITVFEYDINFNLLIAKRSDQKSVQFTYNSANNVASVNMDKYLLNIDYDNNEHPNAFYLQDIGKTKVGFEDGTIKSKEDTEIASKIMVIFKEMMDFIKSAETNLNTEY